MTQRIAALNDARRLCVYGFVVTPGFLALPESPQAAIQERVRTFDAFTEENDPYGEHDFGSIVVDGYQIYW